MGKFSLIQKYKQSFLGRNQFIIMLIMSVSVAIIMVVISMLIYNNSGAAQLDLSRPGYVSVRDKAVKNDDNFQSYSGSGEINQTTISEFQILFSKQAKKIKSVDAFGGDPLSPEALGLGTVVVESQDPTIDQ